MLKRIFTDKKIIMTMLSILLVLSIMTSTTYSLFFKVNTLENVESFTAGVLDISVDKGNLITLSDTLPMSDVDGANLTPYTFTIKNTGNLAYTFDLKMLSTTSSNAVDNDYVKVKIDDNEPVTLGSLTDGILREDILLEPKEKLSMSVRIWLDEDTPNSEIGKNFTAKIITDGVGSKSNVVTERTPAEMIEHLGLTSLVKTGTPDFTSVATTDEGLYTAEDDLGTSYYFRGASQNNYVYFAGFYWRIVRINGDGTIRLIYDGTIKHENGEKSLDRHISKSAYNETVTSNAGVGYMYGNPEASTYEDTHANINLSTLKETIDAWYRDNIDNTVYEEYVADAIYCNDRKVGNSGNGIGTNETSYSVATRISFDYPILNCNQQNDRFTQSTEIGNGALASTYPIGTITADEVIMAGTVTSSEGYNLAFYLYTGYGYWTMSPESVSSTSVAIFNVDESSSLSDNISSNLWNVRPVISLNSYVMFKGDGTYESPFYIDGHSITDDTNLEQKFSYNGGRTPASIIEVNGDKYVMPDVSGTSDNIGQIDGIYYPIVEMMMSDGTDSHAQKATWYAYYPVFYDSVTIVDTDPITGNKIVYDSSTQTIPNGLTVADGLQTAFNYGTEDTVPTAPVIYEKFLHYSSPLISAAKDEYNTVVKYKYVDLAGDTYYYYVGYHANAQTVACFTTGTLITLSDGTQKPIEDITFYDRIMAWDFFTGKYVEKDISLLINHGEGLYKIANMVFSDGTVLRIIGNHGVFDYDLNKYIYITPENVHEYVGHRFVQYNKNGEYNIVTLDEGYMTEEYTGSYSLSSAGTSNAFASSMLTVAPPDDFYNWIEMSDKLRYDVDKFNQDVEKYGLYTYDDFKEYLTYEQYMAFNGAYLKVPVEKGLFTFDYILDLIDAYVEYMPKEIETFQTGKYMDRYNYMFDEIKK